MLVAQYNIVKVYLKGIGHKSCDTKDVIFVTSYFYVAAGYRHIGIVDYIEMGMCDEFI